MRVITNNVPRDILYWHDLTDREKGLLDYRDTEQAQADYTGFRYKDWIYDLSEFEVVHPIHKEIQDWDGINHDSFFSATVMRFTNDYDSVIVGRVYA